MQRLVVEGLDPIGPRSNRVPRAGLLPFPVMEPRLDGIRVTCILEHGGATVTAVGSARRDRGPGAGGIAGTMDNGSMRDKSVLAGALVAGALLAGLLLAGALVLAGVAVG